MLARVAAIMLNTYREAVRARVLHGLFAVALATVGYAIVVGQFALRSGLRTVSDLGAASVSFYGVIVAVVLAATALYREIELKTVFPILARPIRRSEYLVGKYLGIGLTLGVFVAANSGAFLLALAFMTERPVAHVAGVLVGSALAGGVVAWRVPRLGSYTPALFAVVVLASGWVLAADAADDRRVIAGAAVLTLCEVGIVTAVAMVFAAFSSPVLTATFTLGVFLVGRSADTLARLPERVFGAAIHEMGAALSRVVPNLMLYVPPRPLLTGEATEATLRDYVPMAATYALAWSIALLAVAAVVFRRRDFL
jgi:Cu-processing system permease protein